MLPSKFENIIPRNVEDEMKESYLRYSMSVIISRALPDARDGLKPSQRRILYAMRLLGLSPGGKHRKCAKICGDTSGDFHPHGEMVIYPTLVRMAQEWCMRYMLVNGQGNFGSVDGDPPAAMRYAEARLTQPSVLLMEDLEKETVDLVPNYDETKMEPVVFPSKFPNLLCNGSSGIAVGMATNIPPQNLQELVSATQKVIENPETTIEEIMEIMPAPDFPTGGVICGYRGIKEAYHTGRGKFTLRSKIEVEENGDRSKILIKELPYNVNKARLITQIANLIHNKVITGISDIRDDSDKLGLQVVIDLKRNEVPDVIINQLYKYTDIQVTFGCNMLALDKGLPRVMNIKQFIIAWVEHRIEVIRRRTRYELNKAEDRAHILEGYLKALHHLDEVVKIIRSKASREEAKSALMELYDLSERQSNAVLDLKLYQLTGLEQDKINNEYQKLLEKIKYLTSILASEQLVREIIIEELEQVRSVDKTPRRTKIIAAEGDLNIEDLITNEPVILTISQDDYIKRMPMDTFREQRRGGSGVIGFDLKKEDDSLKSIYVANTHDYLLVFTSLGRCYWIKVWQIPESGRRSKGRPLINLLEDIQPGEKIATILKVSSFDQEGHYVFLSTVNGIVKKTQIQSYANPRRKGIYAITIDEGDSLMNANLVGDDQQIMLFTKQGMAIRFDADQVRAMGRTARGVKGVSLKSDKDLVVACEVVNGDEQILIVCENGFGKRSNVDSFRKTHRGGVGVRSIITNDRNGCVLGALSIEDHESVLMMSKQGQTIRFGMDNLRVMGRATQGVNLVNLRDGDSISAVQKISSEDEEEESETTEVLAQDESKE
ncbi:MAG: DNA gyrase subunit A [Chlamydiae bacterium]|nr:DNA gyrase subunit A [Chlamydiota bacterium]